jgi:hypothetical protein
VGSAGGTDGFVAGVNEGVILTGIEGEGRTRFTGGTDVIGVALNELTGVVGAGVVAGVAEAAADGATDAVGCGLTDGDGRVRGVKAGVALADGVVAAALVAGVALGAALMLALAAGEGDGRTRGEKAGLGLATVVAPAAGDCAAGVAAGAVTVVSEGFTNRFGGAFGGGVASVRNFVRARSAADRSVMAVHPLSMLTSTTRSFTRRGRGISRISVISGTDSASAIRRSSVLR